MWGVIMSFLQGDFQSTSMLCTDNDEKAAKHLHQGSAYQKPPYGGAFSCQQEQPKTLELDEGCKLSLKPPVVMGIINATADSFYARSRVIQTDMAVEAALKMTNEGARILDIGGESTRPGSQPVDEKEEIDRVVPVIQAISQETDTVISIDTQKRRVAEAAVKAGASIVNDISALRADPGMLDFVCHNQLAVVVMHMKGTPQDMQKDPHYCDVISEISLFFQERVESLKKKGLRDGKIILDPGIGFGKAVQHNLQIMNHLERFQSHHLPIMIGTSRKSFIGAVLGLKEPEKRLYGTLATTLIAYLKGAQIFRVHDVLENSNAIRMAFSIVNESCECGVL